MRPFRNGKGSYDLIMPKFKKFADSRNQTNYYVRGTFTHYNLDFAKDVLSLADMGFNVIQTIFEKLKPKRELKISTSNLPLYDKITMITDDIITPTKHDNLVQVPAERTYRHRTPR